MAIEELEGIGKMYRFDDNKMRTTKSQYSVYFTRPEDKNEGFPTGFHDTPLIARSKAEMLKTEGKWIEGEWPKSGLDQFNQSPLRASDKKSVREFNEAGLTPPTASIVAPKPTTATVVVNAPAKNPLDDFITWLKSIVGR